MASALSFRIVLLSIVRFLRSGWSGPNTFDKYAHTIYLRVSDASQRTSVDDTDDVCWRCWLPRENPSCQIQKSWRFGFAVEGLQRISVC